MEQTGNLTVFGCRGSYLTVSALSGVRDFAPKACGTRPRKCSGHWSRLLRPDRSEEVVLGCALIEGRTCVPSAAARGGGCVGGGNDELIRWDRPTVHSVLDAQVCKLLWIEWKRMDELDVLHDVAARLEGAEIPYMLTGSMAVNYYAEPRMTRDIDLVVDVRVDEIPDLISAFESDYYIPRGALEEAVRRRSVFNLIHRESVLKIDFVLRKHTRYREVEFERRRRVRLGSADVCVVRKEDLIISKIAWAEDSQSDVQKRDVRNLMATGYDEEYLEHWLKELNLYQFARNWLK